MSKVLSGMRCGFCGFDKVGAYLGPLGLRLLLAWEFWEAGVMKIRGENWFPDIADKFPFPFNLIPLDVSWALVTWFEILGAIALVLGLATRFFSLSLMILTVVAIVTVHAGNGYTISEGGWKLPLMYLVMFLPLLLSGAGKLSLDHWLAKRAFKA
jgi:putative oxidoreductase